MGYGQSKWVVEKTLERAALEKNARVGVLRIGQLVGQ
jgi:thioester reductase-like protein